MCDVIYEQHLKVDSTTYADINQRLTRIFVVKTLNYYQSCKHFLNYTNPYKIFLQAIAKPQVHFCELTLNHNYYKAYRTEVQAR